MKSLGDKASGLFEKKKKDAGDLAQEKLTNAQKLVEEQKNKAVEGISGAKAGAEAVANDTVNGAGELLQTILIFLKNNQPL